MQLDEFIEAFDKHVRSLGPTWLDDESGPALLCAIFGVDE